MQNAIFASDSWRTALDKYAEATGLTVRLYGTDAEVALDSTHVTPLVALFREHDFDPGMFDACARRCLLQTHSRPIVFADEQHGLTVIGTSLVLEDAVVGAAVAGYALAEFPNISLVQRWAQSSRLPFYRLWEMMRRKSPVSERRLALHGDLLKVLGDSLLRESHRTLQHQDAVLKLKAAAAAKDDFLAVLSHELRAPLAPIVGWAGVLKKNESPEVRTAAEAIERNALLQSRMVDDLLDTSRIAHRAISLDLQTHDLSALLRAAVETSVEDMRKQAIRLEFTDSQEPLFVRGDSGRLQQVFRNIISNAVKFTPSEGSIRIAISGEAGAAQVTVADSGVGITPDFLPFVFDIFRQQEQGLRRKFDGLGIGLALVKQLTELHKGTVVVSSAGIGTGTEVTIRLPLVAAMPDRRHAPAEAGPRAAALAGLSILVVEHSEDAREFLRILLQRLGATVSTARDGAEALDRTRDLAPDVVLCDLRLPVMDGYEFLRELRSRPVHPPVVAISGLASDDDRRRTRLAGFHSHIKKPFDAAAVIAAVKAAMRYRKERPHAAIAPVARQTPAPTGIPARQPARAERRSIARGAGDKAAGSAHGKTFSANRDDARAPARGSLKRQP